MDDPEEEQHVTTTQRGRVVKRKRTYDDEFTPNHAKTLKPNPCSRNSPTYENGHDERLVTAKSGRRRRSEILGSAADISEQDLRSLSMGLRGKGGMSSEQMKACVGLIEDARRHEDSWPFRVPVDKKTPLYYEVIGNPMDLRTILNKLKGYRYDSVQEVINDVKLMFQNCRTFNEDGSVVSECGLRLEAFMMEKINLEITGVGRKRRSL